MARVKFTTTLKPETVRLLKIIAEENGAFAGRVIDKLVEKYMEKKKTNPKLKLWAISDEEEMEW